MTWRTLDNGAVQPRGTRGYNKKPLRELRRAFVPEGADLARIMHGFSHKWRYHADTDHSARHDL
jgi:hypothetical protein